MYWAFRVRLLVKYGDLNRHSSHIYVRDCA